MTDRRRPTTQPEASDEVEINVDVFIQSAAHAVPVAGLLAAEPELRDALLTRSEWERRLADYLASPRP